MTREQAKILLPVMQAWSEGKTIQFKTAPNADWIDWNNDLSPGYDQDWQWRVKPAAREFWIAFGKADGLVKYIHSGILPQPNAAEDTEIIHVREITEP